MSRVRPALAAIVVAVGVACAAAPAAQADDSITPVCNGQPCVAGWYTSPVFLSWSWAGGPSTSGCSTQDYIVDTNTTVSCTVQFPDGSTTRQYILKVQTDSPSSTATLSRPPDSNGWYNHPVGVTFAGSSFSGIASCTQAAYGGPPTASATVAGSCTDNAGKTANASVSLNYDDSPPTILSATASRPPDPGGYYTHPVVFTFKGTDAVSGIASCDTVTYRGPSSGSVVGGCRDRAGNYATVAIPVRYRRPSSRASITRASSSLLLRWKPTARASYYNIQIYRGAQKVLSSWPNHTSLLLRRSWSFAGHRFALKPGRYRWYVWPGYGSRAAARYGHLIVSASFRVSKRR